MKKYRALWLFGAGLALGMTLKSLVEALGVPMVNPGNQVVVQILACAALLSTYFLLSHLPDTKAKKARKPAKKKVKV